MAAAVVIDSGVSMLCSAISVLRTCYVMKIEKMIPHMNSFQLNPLHYTYFINTKLNERFGLLENNITSVYKCFRYLNLCIFNIKKKTDVKVKG